MHSRSLEVLAALFGLAFPWLFWISSAVLDSYHYDSLAGLMFLLYWLVAFPPFKPVIFFWPSLFWAHVFVVLIRATTNKPLFPVFYSLGMSALVSVAILFITRWTY